DQGSLDDLLLDVSGEEESSDADDVLNVDSIIDEIETDDQKTDEIVEDNAELTDPDDIDALMDSMAAETPSVESEPAVEIPDNTELTDPDDIDALMDSMAAETPSTESEPAVEIPDNTELTDPDDIDALMDSMAGEAPSAESEPAEELPDNVELTDPDDIDALLDSMTDTADNSVEDTISPEIIDDLSEEMDITDPDDIDALLGDIQNDPAPVKSVVKDTSSVESSSDVEAQTSSSTESDENHEKIDGLSEEYVAPFLSTDFGDMFEVDELIESEKDHPVDDAEVEATSSIEDELDIDALIAEVEQDKTDDEALDIGDDILDSQPSSTFEELNEVDEDILADVSSDFDESTLTQLLNDEKESQASVELSPDFTDSNVLADLLADENGNNEKVKENTEATEIDDIQELDSLDFDELLANIEEEAPASSGDDFDLSDDFNVEETIEDEESEIQHADNNQDDFISVDSLISETLSEPTESEEPYEQTNIDVGLGDFPEFTNDVNQIDVDEEDDNGAAAKLDLAKVYIEIGDSENAEVILQDVVKIGDAEQQFEAQQLLDGIK
ncbi:MAG: hypothetical protein KC484_12565, partial [Colwelliaceae bacterium]|nr:hypothetical protein [Colwelliaceae bacterium]